MGDSKTTAGRTMRLDLDDLAPSDEPPILVQLAGPGAVRFFPLTQEVTRIGRGNANNEIVLRDPWVSREHTEILLLKGEARLRDRGSRNGCILNSKVVRRARLSDGDILQVGKATFKYLEADSAETPFYQEVFRLAFHDPVTGTYSRRYFDEALEREILRTQRHEAPLSLLIADVDHFKEINDKFGHKVGDKVLRAVSTTLRDNLRGESIVARYGGDEFVALLPLSEEDESDRAAERVRSRVETLGVDTPELKDTKLSLSIGVLTAFPDENTKPDRLLEAADQAMYEAKRAGRNRVSRAQVVTETDPLDLPTPKTRDSMP